MTTGLTSASGFLSLLEEKEPRLQIYALKTLNNLVDEFWPEISDSINQIEVLNENEQFEARDLAALVASKVYYHIGHFESAMIYALAAGNLFNINEDSLYVRTLVSKCIDEYIRQRTEDTIDKDVQMSTVPLKELERIIDSVFEHSYAAGEFKYALGIALEAKRLDRVEEIIRKSEDVPFMLDYCFKRALKVVISRDFRQKVLAILVRLYRELNIKDSHSLCAVLIFLDDYKSVAGILNTLLDGNDDDFLLAAQIAFDLCENAPQQFRTEVRNLVVSEIDSAQADSEQAKIQEYYAELLKQKEGQPTEAAPSAEPAPAEGSKPEISEAKKNKLEKMKSILSGATSTTLFLEFLHRNNRTDKLILKNVKSALESKSSLVYSSIIICNAFMNAGTTNDYFLRDNLEWLSAASNWSKFSATAGLGVIQKGHFKESKIILAPYLPQGPAGASPYSEGGALYALGLIHANHGGEAIGLLRTALQEAGPSEIVQHGACLGIGVAGMATRNTELFDDLKNVLFSDSAVAGEAAGMAMGLVMLGSADANALNEMLPYASETQHEKIIRGLAVGIALVMCGREEEADTLIEQLVLSKDPILRYGGMYTVALAYAGTGNNAAIKKLLHVAVSDVSDDVRRAAVLGLGFVLFGQPEQCPKLVALLAESYNPHVRYGATLAVGISCAGTGLKEAVDLLEPLTKDPVDFVRQGALIALALVLIQTSKAQEPRVDRIRKLFAQKLSDKHEDAMCKFGACLATGIIDAGGRNVTISPQSVGGHKNINTIVGLAVFTQYWYWHPLAHFLSLAFTPTAIIGLNSDLKMPVFKWRSNAKASLFAYPAALKAPVAKAPVKLKSAELSITKKARTRQQKKDDEKKKDDKMETDESSDKKEEEKKVVVEEIEKKKEEKKVVVEPDFVDLSNPARVTMRQRNFLSFDIDERYQVVKKADTFGIVLLRDTKPDLPGEFVTPKKPTESSDKDYDDDGEEPAAPEPFEYDPEKEKDD